MIEKKGEARRDHDRAISVLIVDDNSAIREALTMILQGEPDLKVCGEASTADEALQQCAVLKPEIAMIDISLKGASGIDLINDLTAVESGMKCVVFSLHDEALYIDAARKAGACGYITKGQAPQEIARGLRRVRDGELHFPQPYSP